MFFCKSPVKDDVVTSDSKEDFTTVITTVGRTRGEENYYDDDNDGASKGASVVVLCDAAKSQDAEAQTERSSVERLPADEIYRKYLGIYETVKPRTDDVEEKGCQATVSTRDELCQTDHVQGADDVPAEQTRERSRSMDKRAWDASGAHAFVRLKKWMARGDALQTVRSAFTAMDRDGNGQLSSSELLDALYGLKGIGIAGEENSDDQYGFDLRDVQAMVYFADSNGDAKISFDEFQKALRVAPQAARRLGPPPERIFSMPPMPAPMQTPKSPRSPRSKPNGALPKSPTPSPLLPSPPQEQQEPSQDSDRQQPFDEANGTTKDVDTFSPSMHAASLYVIQEVQRLRQHRASALLAPICARAWMRSALITRERRVAQGAARREHMLLAWSLLSTAFSVACIASMRFKSRCDSPGNDADDLLDSLPNVPQDPEPYAWFTLQRVLSSSAAAAAAAVLASILVPAFRGVHRGKVRHDVPKATTMAENSQELAEEDVVMTALPDEHVYDGIDENASKGVVKALSFGTPGDDATLAVAVASPATTTPTTRRSAAAREALAKLQADSKLRFDADSAARDALIETVEHRAAEARKWQLACEAERLKGEISLGEQCEVHLTDMQSQEHRIRDLQRDVLLYSSRLFLSQNFRLINTTFGAWRIRLAAARRARLVRRHAVLMRARHFLECASRCLVAWRSFAAQIEPSVVAEMPMPDYPPLADAFARRIRMKRCRSLFARWRDVPLARKHSARCVSKLAGRFEARCLRQAWLCWRFAL